MANPIFREKSMEQLSAPEQLTDYLHVTGPGVWFLLGGVLLLLGGLLIWGTFGRISTTVQAPVLINDGTAVCYLQDDDELFRDDLVEIEVGGQTLTASTKDRKTIMLDDSADPALFTDGMFSPGRTAVTLSCETDLEDGTYVADVTTETLKPISLLFSRN